MAGIKITFTSGTDEYGGSVTVTNANTGGQANRELDKNDTAAGCAVILSFVAGNAGYQANASFGVCTITGTGITVQVVGATIDKQDIPR